jgi:indolepyruvate ferredoxin oxidoreductase alpha subunit
LMMPEAKDLTREVFEFSSRMKHPAILRTTTRLSHTRGPVTLGEPLPPRSKGDFKKDPARWTVIPAHARRLRQAMLERWGRIEEEVERFPYNKLEKHSTGIGVIASGIAYGYVADALGYLEARSQATVLKLATTIPPPRKMLLDLLSSNEKILVVEELEPIVEWWVRRLAQEECLDVEIHGKDMVNRAGELTLETVAKALAGFLGEKYPWTPIRYEPRVPVPPRPPTLCPGCPHRALFYALKRAVNRTRTKPIYSGDIGCYSLGVLPPFEMQDTLVEMGGSIGLANGFAHVNEEKTAIAIIGDSTFFHAVVPGLINAVYNKSPMLVVVLDNRVTAMTGHQPHPGTGFYATGEPAPIVRIEDVARGVGIEHVSTADPFNVKETEKKLMEALEYVRSTGKPALVVARRACTLLIDAMARRRGVQSPLYTVDEEKCTGCGICYNAFSCPAIIPLRNGKAEIDPSLCTGCGVCAKICPFNAIRQIRPGDPEWEKLWF